MCSRCASPRPAKHRLTVLALLVASLGCESVLLSPPQYGEVHVTVTTDAGAPVPDIPLTLYTGQRPIEYAKSDLAGSYTFQRVPRGSYGVLATVPAGTGDLGDSYLVRDGLEMTPGVRRTVAFTLARCEGAIIVAVREVSGEPAIGVPLTLYSSAGVLDTARSAQDGTHRFASVTCGEYGVQLGENPGYTLTPGRGGSYLDGIRLTRVSPPFTASFAVQRCRATLRVRAVDAASAGVAGATATVFTTSGQLATGLTRSDGTLDFISIPCGLPLGVAITPPTGYSVPAGRGSSVFDGIRLADGASADVVFRLNRP